MASEDAPAAVNDLAERLAKVIVPRAASVDDLAELLAKVIAHQPSAPADAHDLAELLAKFIYPQAAASSSAGLAELLAKVISPQAAGSAAANDLAQRLAKVIASQATDASAAADLPEGLAKVMASQATAADAADLAERLPKVIDDGDLRGDDFSGVDGLYLMGLSPSKDMASHPFAASSFDDDLGFRLPTSFISDNNQSAACALPNSGASRSPSFTFGTNYLKQVTAPRPTTGGRAVRTTTTVPPSLRFTHDVEQPKVKDAGDQREASAPPDELDMLKEENKAMLEKLRLVEERCEKAEARARELEKQVAALGEGVSLEAKLPSSKRRQREGLIEEKEDKFRVKLKKKNLVVGALES